MTKEHPNIAVLKQFYPANVAENIDVLAEDVVVVWRIVDERITEVWDISYIHAAHTSQV